MREFLLKLHREYQNSQLAFIQEHPAIQYCFDLKENYNVDYLIVMIEKLKIN